jgi:glutamate-1-semialdehyde 2,1-aminomutase
VKTADAGLFQLYHRRLLEKGVFVPPSQFEACFVSEAHTLGDVNESLSACASALDVFVRL